MKPFLFFILALLMADQALAQWWEEEDASGLTFTAGATHKVKLYTENSESSYQDGSAWYFGAGKSTFRLHGHGQSTIFLMANHQSTRANYYDGYKTLSMTNVEAQYKAAFSLGHLIFVGLEVGGYVAVPLSVKGEAVRTSNPAYNAKYERPYVYQGFLAGGVAGIKLAGIVLSVHQDLNIPFIQLYKSQPTDETWNKIKPQLLVNEGFRVSLTIKGRD